MKLWIPLILFYFGTVSVLAQTIDVDGLLSKLSTDSLFQPIQNRVDSIQTNFYLRTDSLRTAYSNKLESLNFSTLSLQNRLDSLTSLHLPTSKITHLLDSINQLKQKTIAGMSEKLQSLKNETTSRLKELNVPPEISKRVSEITGSIDSFSVPSTGFDISSGNLSTVGLPDSPLGNLKDLQLNSSLSDVGNMEGIGHVTDKVSAITGDIGGYSEDIKELAQGNLSEVNDLPKTAEGKVADLSGLNDLQQQTEVLEEYKGVFNQLQNPETMKSQVVENLQHAAMDHFAGKQEVLQQAMETVSKYKKLYSSVPDISALPKKRPNAMHGKPLIERLIPGIAVQIQKDGNDLKVDFNPYLGYRLTGKITAGLGWNQRVAYNTDHNVFSTDAPVYGPRTFAEYNLWKGFCPRAEVELMNAFVPPLTKPATIDLGNRQWVWGVFVGMKKDYNFIRGVKGTALVMFRLFDPEHKSPYADLINARIGFEFPMKKGRSAKGK